MQDFKAWDAEQLMWRFSIAGAGKMQGMLQPYREQTAKFTAFTLGPRLEERLESAADGQREANKNEGVT